MNTSSFACICQILRNLMKYYFHFWKYLNDHNNYYRHFRNVHFNFKSDLFYFRTLINCLLFLTINCFGM